MPEKVFSEGLGESRAGGAGAVAGSSLWSWRSSRRWGGGLKQGISCRERYQTLVDYWEQLEGKCPKQSPVFPQKAL